MKPPVARPGVVQFDTTQGIEEISGLQWPGKHGGGTSVGGGRWREGIDGAPVVAASLVEEEVLVKNPATGGYQSHGIVHIVMAVDNLEGATRNVHIPDARGPDDFQKVSATISYIDAPASQLRRHGIDPDVPRPCVSSEKFDANVGGVGGGPYRDSAAAECVELFPGAEVPVLDAQTLPGGDTVYTIYRFRGRRTFGGIQIGIDAHDVRATGKATVGPDAHFEAVTGRLETILLASRKISSPNDMRRLTVAVVSVPIVIHQ